MSDERQGFTGLNALVSDVSDLPPVPAAPPKPAAPAGDPGSAWVCPPPPRKKWPVQETIALLVLGGIGVMAFVNWQSRPPALAIEEEKPPIANAQILSKSQFKYCISQEIRLKGAAEAALETSLSDLARLKDLSNDFALRCGDAKYYVKGTSTIRNDVEANRHKLEREGVILLRFPSSS